MASFLNRRGVGEIRSEPHCRGMQAWSA